MFASKGFVEGVLAWAPVVLPSWTLSSEQEWGEEIMKALQLTSLVGVGFTWHRCLASVVVV